MYSVLFRSPKDRYILTRAVKQRTLFTIKKCYEFDVIDEAKSKSISFVAVCCFFALKN